MNATTWTEARIREVSQTAAAAVAKNAGVAPQLCFPHIYLTLKDALAGAVEAQPVVSDNEAEREWRRLALQFDGHRMQAIGHLKCMVQDPNAHKPKAEAFLAAGPLSGEAVLADRLRALTATQPAPVASDDLRDTIEKLVDHLRAIHNLDRFPDVRRACARAVVFAESSLASTQPAVTPALIKNWQQRRDDDIKNCGEASSDLFGYAEAEIADLRAALGARKPAAPDTDELHYNASRLRNVAALVGVIADGTDEFVDGARGALLGQIAAKLRAPSIPAQATDMVQVCRTDAEAYCRIVKLLGMEEEGDPVAEVERLLSIPAQAGVPDGELEDRWVEKYKAQSGLVPSESERAAFRDGYATAASAPPQVQAGVPDGSKLMPPEASRAMIDAAMAIDVEGEDDTIAAYGGLYEAFFAAAPSELSEAPSVRDDAYRALEAHWNQIMDALDCDDQASALAAIRALQGKPEAPKGETL